MLSAPALVGAPFARLVLRSDGNDEFKAALVGRLVGTFYGASPQDNRPSGDARVGAQVVGTVERAATSQQVAALVWDMGFFARDSGELVTVHEIEFPAMPRTALPALVEKPHIRRNLHEGWDFRIDWRMHQVNAYRDQVAACRHRKFMLQQILYLENDIVVRLGLLFRVKGRSGASEAFEWAFKCAHGNARSGILTILKAMVIAGLPREVIGAQLGTKRINIVVAEKLFADFRPYLSQRIWLQHAVVNPPLEGVATREMAQERRLLNVAFEHGPERLLKVLRGGDDATHEDLDATAKKLEAIAGQRALEYVRGLDRDAVPCNEDDVRRFILARGLRSREAATTAVEPNAKLQEFGLNLVKMLSEPKKKWDAKTVESVATYLPVNELKEVMNRQIRERAAEQAKNVTMTTAEPQAPEVSAESPPTPTAAP